jgi:hypothetical protein
MTPPIPSTTLPDTETKVLHSLVSRFSVDTEEQIRLGDSCKLSAEERVGRPNPHAASVGIAQVSTLVCTGKGGFPGTSYVVPPFAVHWGIIVRRFLFHLRYNSENKTVKFRVQEWEQPKEGSKHKVDVVGSTKYNGDELYVIGICI